MARAAAGEAGAFARIVSRYEARLGGFVARMLGDRERARDIVQEVFLAIYRSRTSYRPGEPFAPWAFSIARNACLNELARARRVRPVEPAAAGESGTAGGGALEELERRESLELLAAALESLPREEREVTLLRLAEGMPFRWIARVTGVPESTVRLRFNRGMERLRRLLGP